MRQSPRLVALRVLERVENDGAFANLALDSACADAGLSPRDAALATELTYGVLRRRNALDRALAPFIRSGWQSLEPEVRDVLRLGAYQILYTRIPDHAAVTETVNVAKRAGLYRAAGLVNAVLRRLAEQGPPPPLDPEKEPRQWLEVEGSLPPWLAERLLEILGPKEAVAFVEAIHRPPRAAIRANVRRIGREALRRMLAAQIPDAAIEPSAWAPAGLLVERGGSLSRTEAFEKGLFSLQDEAAQLVVHLCGDVQGMRVLDCCAAPGGKSCHLAELGAREVVAMDRNPRKAKRIEEEARRLGLDAIAVEVGDATVAMPKGKFDLVLVDAPCTSVGTLRRHPELRYRLQPEDVVRLVETQAKILDTAAGAVRRGGLLVYAVCSFLPEEGERQIRALLDRHPRFEPAPPEPAPGWAREGWILETWPHRHGMDAFFAARLRAR